MTGQGRGPQAKLDSGLAFRRELRNGFRWRGDRTDSGYGADITGWWANPATLSRLGPALSDLFADVAPSVVLGPQSRGALLGALVAVHRGIGLVELRKDPAPMADSDRWVVAHTPPDYRDLNLRVGARRDLLAGRRVLFVDDWIATGGQAYGGRTLVEAAGGEWCGCAVIVDQLTDRAGGAS